MKYARVYGEWLHLEGLPEDAKTVRVTLNANSHETLSLNGQPIQAILELDQ